MISEPNCRFIELLPEATLRIGIALENTTLTRAAYSVLVSEEALRIGHNKNWLNADSRIDMPLSKAQTLFGRKMEDLDEDSINMIQHAGLDFAARIDGILQGFLDPKMPCKYYSNLHLLLITILI